jgi:hypothetical protein
MAKQPLRVRYIFLKLLFFLSLLTACSSAHRTTELLTTYDPLTAPFAVCPAAPWSILLERARNVAIAIHPNAQLLAIDSSPRSAIGYASELIISFEFRVIFEPVQRSDTREPAPVITVEVPECTLDATRVVNSAISGNDQPALPADLLAQIQITPRDVFNATKSDAEVWLGRPLEPHDIGTIHFRTQRPRNQPQAPIPSWGIVYDDFDTERTLVFTIDVESGNIISTLKTDDEED